MKKSNDLVKPEDFENQLRRQPRREVPADWRSEILAIAASATETLHATRNKPASLSTFLRSLLWPCPQAWAGLAAVWLVLLLVNYSPSGKKPVMAQNTTPPSPEVKLALREQRRLLAQLLEPFDQAAAEPPKRFIPRPKAEGNSKFIVV
jgi:hypothetical protein